jgi:hypothetical protein
METDRVNVVRVYSTGRERPEVFNEGKDIRIGRDPQWAEYVIPPDWKMVSNRHAILRQVGNSLFYEPVARHYPFLVNQQSRTSSVEIRDGDRIHPVSGCELALKIEFQQERKPLLHQRNITHAAAIARDEYRKLGFTLKSLVVLLLLAVPLLVFMLQMQRYQFRQFWEQTARQESDYRHRVTTALSEWPGKANQAWTENMVNILESRLTGKAPRILFKILTYSNRSGFRMGLGVFLRKITGEVVLVLHRDIMRLLDSGSHGELYLFTVPEIHDHLSRSLPLTGEPGSIKKKVDRLFRFHRYLVFSSRYLRTITREVQGQFVFFILRGKWPVPSGPPFMLSGENVTDHRLCLSMPELDLAGYPCPVPAGRRRFRQAGEPIPDSLKWGLVAGFTREGVLAATGFLVKTSETVLNNRMKVVKFAP